MVKDATQGEVTLQDLATECGVAVSTVSRALTRPDRVSESTRARIVAAAERLGYEPSVAGRALSSGRTQTIGLMVPDVTNPYFFGIIRGTQSQLRAAGYAHVLVDTEESAALEEESLRRLRRSCDGVILAASRLGAEEIAAWDRVLPLVLLNRSVEGVASVEVDSPDGARQALDHLVSLGHRRIAYVRGPAGSGPDRHRREVLGATAPRYGADLVVTDPFAPTSASGPAAADTVLRLGATACIVFNDLMAISMLRRFADRGVDVPGAMSVVGCDDIFGADFCNPPLTTVTVPTERPARTAAALLLDRLRTGRRISPERPLPAHLTIRESSAPPRRDP
jgi:DNA-binding LacI/PurR family transcriptional regulator